MNKKCFRARIIWLTLAAFLLAITAQPAAAQSSELSAGISAYQAKDYARAVERLNRVVTMKGATVSELSRAYTYLVYCHFYLNEWLSAEDALRNVLSHQPNFVPEIDDPLLRTLFSKVKKEMLNSLRIASEPEDADIYMDDVLIGRTPHIAPSIEPGLHIFIFKKSGFAAMQKSIYIEPSTINRLDVTLQQGSGKRWIWYLLGSLVVGGAVAFGLSGGSDSGEKAPVKLGEPPDPPN